MCGAAFHISKENVSIEQGIEMAREIIDSGKALKQLDDFIELTNAQEEIKMVHKFIKQFKRHAQGMKKAPREVLNQQFRYLQESTYLD